MWKQIEELRRDVVRCHDCPRLVEHRELIARVKKKQFLDWNYWGRPVPGFGDVSASMFVIGLAPAPHGGNRTGRVFTGDRSAEFLMRSLWKAGFASQPTSTNVDDGLKLTGAYMTAAVKCVPPGDKPTREEMETCAHFLKSEMEICDKSRVILCLGQFAYQSTMRVMEENGVFTSRAPKFEHGLEISLLDSRKVFASYHPSPRNTQTGTLTTEMFDSLLRKIRKRLDVPHHPS